MSLKVLDKLKLLCGEPDKTKIFIAIKESVIEIYQLEQKGQFESLKNQLWKVLFDFPNYQELINYCKFEISCCEIIKLMEKRDKHFLKKIVTQDKKNLDIIIRTNQRYIYETYLHVLKKWNSYTPIVSDQRGGGLFLKIKENGIVIDPGINFLKNYLDIGHNFNEITHIVLTHCHPDHMGDVLGIFSVLQKYRTKSNDNVKKITIICNKTSSDYFSYLFQADAHFIENKPQLLEPGKIIDLSPNMKIKSLKGNHTELDPKNSIAISLKFIFNDVEVLGYSGDTGWFEDLSDFFKNCKNLILNIGSITEEEINSLKNESSPDIFYKNHLGILGLIKMIEKATQCGCFIITELGEELQPILGNLESKLKAVYQKYDFQIKLAKLYDFFNFDPNFKLLEVIPSKNCMKISKTE